MPQRTTPIEPVNILKAAIAEVGGVVKEIRMRADIKVIVYGNGDKPGHYTKVVPEDPNKLSSAVRHIKSNLG